MPSRARTFGRLCVADELAEHDVGQSSLQTAQRFHRGLAGGELAPVVGAAFGVVADLDDGGDVQHVVHPPVPGPRQPVAVLVTGRGVQGCGAGPGREPVAVGEPGHVADVGQDPCGAGRADPEEVHQVRPAGGDRGGRVRP